MATMDSLPALAIQEILKKLPLIDVFRLMRVNKTWYKEANIVLRKKGTQLHTSPGRLLQCRHPEHNKTDPSWILQIRAEKMEWKDVVYILKKMGKGLEILWLYHYEENFMKFVEDLTPNLEFLEVYNLFLPGKVLPKLKHLYVTFCKEDILDRLDEWFPSLEVLHVYCLDWKCVQSHQARFRHGMTSITFGEAFPIDLYEVSQWPALETLKTLKLDYPFCSRTFSFRAPLLEEVEIRIAIDFSIPREELQECLIQSLLKSSRLKNLTLFLHNSVDVNLTKQLLGGLPQLVKFDSDYCVHDEAISIMQATSNNVEELWLHNASVTDATLEHLKNLPRIKKVYIRVTSQGFTFEGLRKFCLDYLRQPDGNIRFAFTIDQFSLCGHSTELEWLGLEVCVAFA